jgi:predicted esterase
LSDATTIERVDTRVHGRFHYRPPGNVEGPVRLLVGFHGFGENGALHMEELERLPGLESWALVAIEALHPFYTRSGRIVACWMTSQDRELAIAENTTYVRTVIDRVVADLAAPVRLSLIGFSQGTAMAYRAGAHCGHPVDSLVALGGDVPPELAELGKLPIERVLIGRGLDEDWYGTDKLASDRETLAGLGLTPEVCEYEGGHEWTDAFRRRAGQFLRSTR